MTTDIALDGVTVRYADTVALDDVSLRIGSGSVTALIGMNGSGKSTLFKVVMGVVAADEGTVTVNGLPTKRARASGSIAYVPQSEAVDWTFPISVAEVVMQGRYGRQGFTRRPSRADREAVAAALDRVGLTELAHRQIGKLSGGQRKRVFVARGIAQQAQVFLLDEPFAGVDKPSEETIIAVLRELAADGAVVVVSTHDLVGLAELADEVVLLRNRVLFHGDVHTGLEPRILARAFGFEEST